MPWMSPLRAWNRRVTTSQTHEQGLSVHLTVKNWDRFQHYKNVDNAPAWIKLYTETLTDYEFLKLSESDRFKLVAIWLLAAKTRNKIPDDAAYVARCIGVRRVDLNVFITAGWLERVYSDPIVVLASVEQRKKEIRAEKKLATKGDHEHATVRLLSVLLDADDGTERVIRGLVKKHSLADGDLEAAREAATGPGVASPSRVAVSELKKRAELAALPADATASASRTAPFHPVPPSEEAA